MTEDGAGGMNRRTVLKGAGVTGAAAAAGGVGLIAMSGTGAALHDRALDISDADVVYTDDGSYEYVSMALSSVCEWEGFNNPATHVRFRSRIRLPGHSTGWHQLFDSRYELENLREGSAGGSLDWTTGEGQTGVVHSGVGDGRVLLDLDWVQNSLHRDHELSDHDLAPQDAEYRWPVMVHPDTDTDDLYDVPTWMETSAPEASEDGREKTTHVRFQKNITVSNDEDDEAEVELNDDFYVTVQNIESNVEGMGEGDVETHTDEERTP